MMNAEWKSISRKFRKNAEGALTLFLMQYARH